MNAPASERDWRRGAVIYQIYPRSYLDTNGDGIGDLAGITQALPHVASLGVDAVWLSPFFTSPMRDFGYDVADYRDVDPVFGTLTDFDALVARAHDLGLKVVIDQVYSHTSDQHAWFAESRGSRDNPKADWYVWADAKPDGSPPNNWQAVFGGPSWTWDARRGQYYLHNFLVEQPDLNLHNEEVQAALLDVARFWLDRGVDGFRLDAVNFMMHDRALTDNPPYAGGAGTRPYDFQDHVHDQSQPGLPAFLERLRALTDLYPQRFTVAEVAGPSPLADMKAYTAGDQRLDTAYSFVFLYAQALTPKLVLGAMADWREGWPSWAFSNHDAPRAVSRWRQGQAPEIAARPLLLLLLALRGNVFLYQGEELGLPQGEVPFDRLVDPDAIANWPKTLGRDGARTPMPWRADAPYAGFSTTEPWLPVDVRHAALAVDVQEADEASMLRFTRRALTVRRGRPALVRGDLREAPASEEVAAFERREGDDRVLCVLNLGEAPFAFSPPQAGDWRVLIASDATAEGDPLPMILPPGAAYWARAEG